MSLPKGYKRLEYIQSSGTQYIDTGFKPNQDTRVVLDCSIVSTKNAAFFGTRSSMNGSDLYVLTHAQDTNAFRSDYGKSKINTGLTPSGRVLIDKNKRVTSINGQSWTNEAAVFSCQYSLPLFGLSTTGNVSAFTKIQLYSCQIYDDGILIRDFVPCQKPDGAVGLWDDIGLKFYGNAGTGSFTAGMMVSEAVPESEIAELEWIQSSGTQYIDTGFKPNQDTRVVSDIEITDQTNPSVCLFGVRNAASSTAPLMFCIWSMGTGTSLRSDYFGASASLSVNAIGRRLLIDKNKNLCHINQSVITNKTGKGQSVLSLYLFTVNNAGAASLSYHSQLKLYSCQIYDNGILIHDFVPCVSSSGEVGLYDRLHGEFYRNAGTGNFIAGPEAPKILSPPENLQVVSGSDTQITLRWNAVEDAVGYKLYRDGILIADLTDTNYSDTIGLFSRYTYSLTAYNDVGESVPAVLDFFAVPEDPVLWLVTDRTQADVEARNEKGIYRAVDLNRVGAVMVYLADRLRRAGHALHTVPKTDWSDADWGCPYTMNRYLQDVATLRSAVRQLSSTPDVPSSMEYVTYAAANDIEKILQALDDALRRMNDTYFYSGELYSGEV